MRLIAAAIAISFAAPIHAGDEFDDLYRNHAQAHGLDWKLIKAIAITESNERADAVHAQSQSVGLMQILCREDGSGGCANRLNDVAGWPPANRTLLFNASYSVLIGTQILAWNIRAYGLHKGIAAYNQWSARHTKSGKPFPNQDYVEKVLRAHRALDQ